MYYVYVYVLRTTYYTTYTYMYYVLLRTTDVLLRTTTYYVYTYNVLLRTTTYYVYVLRIRVRTTYYYVLLRIRIYVLRTTTYDYVPLRTTTYSYVLRIRTTAYYGGGNIMCTCSIFVCRHKNNDMSTLLGHAHTYIPTDRRTYIHTNKP